MPAASPAQAHADPLSHTAPFDRMVPARRAQLIAHAKPFAVDAGECLFPESEAPTEVFIITEGTVCVYADIKSEAEPVFLGEHGPGSCVGWEPGISGTTGIRALATFGVTGLALPVDAFMEIARYEPVLRKTMLMQAGKGEVWRAVLAEMERRTGRISSAAGIVERIAPLCIAREWPEDQAEINSSQNRIWVVMGGEGVKARDRWHGGDGVLWARLVGLPENEFTKALLDRPAGQPRTDDRSDVGEKLVSRPVTITPKRHVQSRGKPLQTVAVVFTLLLLAAAAVATWASRQHRTKRISVTGRLVFTGDNRTITAGAGGVLSEFHLRETEKIQGGALLAVIRPPLDEEGVRRLTGEIARLERDAAFCDAVLSGAKADGTNVPASLMEIARRQAQLAGELRVFRAIERANPNDPALTPAERTRVNAYFANIKRAQDELTNSDTRDASSRYDDLREAEQSLREAQEEVAAHVQAFSGATTGDKDAAAQEIRDYQRILARLNRAVTDRRDAVNRIRKEIASMRPEQIPSTTLISAASSVAPEILLISTAIAAGEEQLKASSTALKADIATARKKLGQLRDDAAPRQIKSLQPGYIIEAAKLTTGTIVRPDTTLGRIITRSAWQIDCTFPETGRMEPGQELAITVADRYATLVYEQFAPLPGSTTRVPLRDSRDDWRDGMAIRAETTVITGTLLDEWLASAGIKRR